MLSYLQIIIRCRFFVFTIGSARATVSYYRYAPFVTYVCSAARLIESRKYAFGREDFQMRKVRITALLVSAVIMISLLPKVLFASNNSEEKLYSGIKNIIFMILYRSICNICDNPYFENRFKKFK